MFFLVKRWVGITHQAFCHVAAVFYARIQRFEGHQNNVARGALCGCRHGLRSGTSHRKKEKEQKERKAGRARIASTIRTGYTVRLGAHHVQTCLSSGLGYYWFYYP